MRLSGLISPGGVPAQLIEAWLDRKFILVSHALQLDELREVSRREKIRSLIRPSEAGRLINQISAVAQIPVALPNVARSRSEEHTSELQSLMRISYDVFCLKKKKNHKTNETSTHENNEAQSKERQYNKQQ